MLHMSEGEEPNVTYDTLSSPLSDICNIRFPSLQSQEILNRPVIVLDILKRV
jgi:hypothetical protein